MVLPKYEKSEENIIVTVLECFQENMLRRPLGGFEAKLTEY
jgi:hypothetical protein